MTDAFKIPIFNIHDLVIIATANAAMLMMIIQAVSPSKNRNANICLMVFFGCLLVHSVCIEILWNALITPRIGSLAPLIVTLACTANLIVGPALYLYISAITQADFHFSKMQVVHAIPAIAITGIFLGLGLGLEDLKMNGEMEYRRLVHDFWLLMKGLPTIYALACIPIALSTTHLMQSYYSTEDNTGKNWLSLLCIGYATFWGWTFCNQLFGGMLTTLWVELSELQDLLGIASNYFALGLLLVLFSYNVSSTQNLLSQALASAQQTITDNVKHITPNNKQANLAKEIIQFTETEKIYLQSNLTAEQFAEHLGYSARDISAVLNQQFGKNFFEYINSYRVAEAQRLLKSPEHLNTSITDIFFMSGFNSKSAFQRFFKRITGISPSEFRTKNK